MKCSRSLVVDLELTAKSRGSGDWCYPSSRFFKIEEHVVPLRVHKSPGEGFGLRREEDKG